jgi:O-antigen/teichoic acid export membrane protein
MPSDIEGRGSNRSVGLYGALRNLVLKGFSLGLERGCRLVVSVASAPVLGQAAFGRFVFASTTTTLLALGADLGLSVWTTRALARSGSDGERVVGVGLGLRTLASLPYGLAVAAVAMLTVRGELRSALALLGVAALLNAYTDHFAAILRGYERFADEARLNTSRAVLTAVLGLAALGIGRSLPMLCAGLATASAGSFAYGLRIVLRYHPLSMNGERSGHAFVFGRWSDRSRALAKLALRQSLPIWLAGVLSLMYFKVDTLFMRFMAGDAELGAYGAAYKLFEGTLLVPLALLSVAFPRLARAHGDRPTQRRLERQIGAVLLGIGFLLGAAYTLGKAPIVRLLFGVGFQRAEASLGVLALGLPLLYLNFGLTHFLVARDMERTTTRLALMMLVVTVVLDVALIPRWSGPGAALATVLAEVALTAGCLAALAIQAPLAQRSTSSPTAARRDHTAA